MRNYYKRGKVSFSKELLETIDKSIKKIVFKDLEIVFREEDRMHNAEIYSCYCEHFDEVKEGDVAPNYIAIFNSIDKSVKWERVN